MSQPTVTITKDLYDQLIKDSNFLSALEGAGVDNWGGYDDAIESLTNTEEEGV